MIKTIREKCQSIIRGWRRMAILNPSKERPKSHTSKLLPIEKWPSYRRNSITPVHISLSRHLEAGKRDNCWDERVLLYCNLAHHWITDKRNWKLEIGERRISIHRRSMQKGAESSVPMTWGRTMMSFGRKIRSGEVNQMRSTARWIQ